jgi:hypothetical protein
MRFWWKAELDIVNLLPTERWEAHALEAFARLKGSKPITHKDKTNGREQADALLIGRPGFKLPPGMQLCAIPVADETDGSEGIFFKLVEVLPTKDGAHRIGVRK